jgi:CheY-like chemotaxis protein
MKPLFKSRAYELLKRKCIDHTEDVVLKPVKQKPKYDARILLVEDNEINMEIAREILVTYGVEIEEATDGLEALAKITNNDEGYYDLIFMDCQMPHMNGIETTKALLDFENESNYKHTPVVAMTANAFDEDRKNALDAGMDGFLVKPIDIKELEVTLGQYLQHKQS